MAYPLSIFITSERSGSLVFLDLATGRWVYTDDKLSSMSEGNFSTMGNSIFLNGPYEEVEISGCGRRNIVILVIH